MAYGAGNVADLDMFLGTMAFWKIYWKVNDSKTSNIKGKIEHTQWFNWKKGNYGTQKKSRRPEKVTEIEESFKRSCAEQIMIFEMMR